MSFFKTIQQKLTTTQYEPEFTFIVERKHLPPVEVVAARDNYSDGILEFYSAEDSDGYRFPIAVFAAGEWVSYQRKEQS